MEYILPSWITRHVDPELVRGLVDGWSEHEVLDRGTNPEEASELMQAGWRLRHEFQAMVLGADGDGIPQNNARNGVLGP